MRAVFYIAGAILHLATIYFLYLIHGVLGAIATFFFPVISQIYLMIYLTTYWETFLVTYNIIVVSYALAYVIYVIILAVRQPKNQLY